MKDDKRSFRQKAGDFLSGRGFYIALTACVLVIGISAWTLLFTSGIADRTDVADNGADATMGDYQKGDDYEDTITVPKVNDSKAPEQQQEKADGSDTEQQDATEQKPAETPAEAPVEEETVETMSPAEQLKFMWPVYGDVTVGYFADELVYNKTMMDWRTHSAVDIAAELGAKVMAVEDGTVSAVYNDDLLGTTVIIDHDGGLQSCYSNLAATPTVSEGDSVTSGTVIGSVGNTAIGETGDVIHLHFAMTKDGVSVDPMEYLPAK